LRRFSKFLKIIFGVAALGTSLLAYQNCGRPFEVNSPGSLGATSFNSSAPECPTGLSTSDELVNLNCPAYVGLAVYPGNSAAKVNLFESWLGRAGDGILAYVGFANWADFNAGWIVPLFAPVDRRIFWSVPLIVTGANLTDAASGAYDAYYRSIAQTIAAYRPDEPVIYLRTGWEFNGDWFPWTATDGKAQAYIGAYQRFVTVFRSVSPRFRFEWNVNVGTQNPAQMNPESAYPGDAYVDMIGMDFYWDPAWDPADPVQAFTSMRTRDYGLQWHQNFAAAHNKPTTYSEWGIRTNNAGPYIDLVKKWFYDHHVIFHTYWDSNSAYPGELSSGQYPDSGEAFRKAFGAGK
jgi:hypothetical protein